MVFGRGRDQQRPDHRAIEAKVDEEMHGLVTQLTNEITFHMRERGITRADLAARMGVSPGRVSQILGGGENLTLRTLAALASALDAVSTSSSAASRWTTPSPVAPRRTAMRSRTSTPGRVRSTSGTPPRAVSASGAFPVPFLGSALRKRH